MLPFVSVTADRPTSISRNYLTYVANAPLHQVLFMFLKLLSVPVRREMKEKTAVKLSLPLKSSVKLIMLSKINRKKTLCPASSRSREPHLWTSGGEMQRRNTQKIPWSSRCGKMGNLFTCCISLSYLCDFQHFFTVISLRLLAFFSLASLRFSAFPLTCELIQRLWTRPSLNNIPNNSNQSPTFLNILWWCRASLSRMLASTPSSCTPGKSLYSRLESIMVLVSSIIKMVSKKRQKEKKNTSPYMVLWHEHFQPPPGKKNKRNQS